MTALRLHGTLLFGLACMSVLQGHAQFVTLEGRRFMLNGQEFYPVVLNYGIEFMSGDTSITHPDSMYYSPSNQHGTSVDIFYECNGPGSCDQQLRTELAQIAALGFNTIRLVGPNARAFRTSSGDRPYKMKVSPIDPYVWSYHVDLSAPDFSDPMSERHFYLIEQILNAADDVGLKVILLTGTEVKTWPESDDQVFYDATDAQNYSAYLHALASHLHDHPALLAYDVLNEPAWRDFNDNIMDLTKADVCEWTGWWYDTLTAADPNHLVTLGGHSIHEIGSWDPAVMKIDFYSPHLYLEGDWDFASIYDMDVITDKYMAELYWLGATLELPWIVGETSFTADDDTTDYGGNQYLDNLPAHHAMPWMHGSEAEQAAFAAEIMAATRAYGGSGWSWWYYQNGRSTRYNEVFPGGKTHRDLRSNYFGVLSFGHGTDPGRVKPIADTVQAYQPAPLPDELPVSPAVYWDWHGLQDFLGSYTIVDQAGPVANAISLSTWEYQKPNPNGPGPISEFAYLRAASNASGYMTLMMPPDSVEEFDRFVLQQVILDAAAGKRRSFNRPNIPQLGISIPLETSRLMFEGIIGPLELISVPSYRLAAWSQLTVSNATIMQSGFADAIRVYARESVQLIDEFHAGNGSEVHIACRKVFANCGEQPYQLLGQPSSPDSPSGEKSVRRLAARPIQLSFQSRTGGLVVWPNPCTDVLWIRTDESASIVDIYDAHGRAVATERINEGRVLVRIADWSPGLYHVRTRNAKSSRGVSFIKTP